MQSTSFVETGAQSSSEPPGPRPPSSPKEARTIAQRGQMLVVFVMSIFVIVGLVGLVIDVSWYWTNTLRVQRAADAAALAGAVQLPSRPATGRADARSQAEKNGYPSLTAACPIGPSTPLPAICAAQDATNRNQMNVTVSAPVGTFFMRVFGIGSITATRASKALYTLPVPMGSPENYYGVFGDVRNATMTNVPPPETDPVATTALKVPTTSPGTATWTVTPTSPSRTLVQAVATNETAAPIYYARSNTNGASQQWSGFGLTSGAGSIPATGTVGNTTTSVAIVGLQVQIDDALVSAACTGLNPNSTIGVSLSWNGGSNWSSMVNTTTPWNPTLTYLPTSATTGDYTIGNNNNTTPWGAHAWTRGDFTDTNFRVRLTANKGATCASGTYLYVDQLQGPGRLPGIEDLRCGDDDGYLPAPRARHGVPERGGRLLRRHARRQWPGPQPARLLGHDEHVWCGQRERRRLPAPLRQPDVRARANLSVGWQRLLRPDQLLQLRGQDAVRHIWRQDLHLRPRVLRDAEQQWHG